jgi:hypothetical protein
MIAKM